MSKEKSFILIIAVMLIVLFAVFVFIGTYICKSGDSGDSGRDYEYGRQMGRASEVLESVDGRIAGVQDGLAGIVVYIGQDAGDLRRLAERLQVIADRVEKMERDLADARDCIRRFLADNDTGTGIELSE